MRHFLVILLALALVFTLTACNKTVQPSTDDEQFDDTEITTDKPEPSPETNTATSEPPEVTPMPTEIPAPAPTLDPDIVYIAPEAPTDPNAAPPYIVVERFITDLDGDGLSDAVAITYTDMWRYSDKYIDYESVEITVHSGTGDVFSTVNEHAESLGFSKTKPEVVRLAGPGSAQFYITSDAMSDTSISSIYTFTGTELTVANVYNSIEHVDGNKLYSSVNYFRTWYDTERILCSYWLYENGAITLVPVEKAEFVGNTVEFAFAYPLCLEPVTGEDAWRYGIATIMQDTYDLNRTEHIENFGDNYAGYVEAHEVCEIIDFDLPASSTPYPLTDPWVKIRTSAGVEGWILLLHGS